MAKTNQPALQNDRCAPGQTAYGCPSLQKAHQPGGESLKQKEAIRCCFHSAISTPLFYYSWL